MVFLIGVARGSRWDRGLYRCPMNNYVFLLSFYLAHKFILRN
jgi:hypothetical protein